MREKFNKKFNNRCLTCKEWFGNKEKTIENIIKSGDIVMDWDQGWPNSGGCGKSHLWVELDIDGDASVSLEFPANFGCVLHDTE